MKKLSFSAIVIAGLALLPMTGFAGTEAGKIELTGMGSYTHSWSSEGGGGQNTYLGSLGVGYFFTDALEAKINGTFVGFSGSGSTMYAVQITAGPDYHFMTTGNLVPYVGVYGGVILMKGSFGGGDTSETGAMIDGHVGLKQFLSERMAIDYRVAYQYWSISDTSINNLMVMIGLSYQL